jgi:hypothetical protein
MIPKQGIDGVMRPLLFGFEHDVVRKPPHTFRHHAHPPTAAISVESAEK